MEDMKTLSLDELESVAGGVEEAKVEHRIKVYCSACDFKRYYSMEDAFEAEFFIYKNDGLCPTCRARLERCEGNFLI